MEVKFDKRYKHLWSDRQWELIKDAVRLFLDQHNMWHVPGKLLIRIGATTVSGAGTVGEFYRANVGRTYEVVVEKRRLFSLTLETLMHELTHCYQIVSGKLIDVGVKKLLTTTCGVV